LVQGDPPRFTEAGRDVRAEIEEATDRQQRPVVDSLGSGVDELVALLDEVYLAMAPSVVDRGSRTGGVVTSAVGTGTLLPDPELLNPL